MPIRVAFTLNSFREMSFIYKRVELKSYKRYNNAVRISLTLDLKQPTLELLKLCLEVLVLIGNQNQLLQSYIGKDKIELNKN